MSDRVTHYPTLEQRMDDVRAVMDAVGSEKAVLFGVSEGGPMAALFSATYPERTLGLVMFATYAKRKWDPEYPWGPTEDQREGFFREIENNWGSPVGIETRAPSRMNDPAFRQWWGSYLRMGASPGAAVMLTRMNAEIDVRSILPTVRVPTLILHRVGDQCIKVGESRYIASQIPGARMVELAGEDHLPFVGDQDALLKEMEIFVNGIPFHSEIDGVLTTILCLQLIGFDAKSTTSAQMKLDQYRQFVRTDVHKFRGRIMVSQEDRMLATFDGPARAIRAAISVREECLKGGIQMKAGIHIGECETIGNRIAGPALTIGTGLAEVADTGEIMVSSMVKDLVPGAGINFEDRGACKLPRNSGEWRIFSVI